MKKLLTTALILAGAASVYAKEPGIRFGGDKFVLAPAVNLGVFHSSNIRNAYDGEKKESGAGWTVSPSLQFSANGAGVQFILGANYSAERSFDRDSGSDSDSWGEYATLRMELNERNSLTINQSFRHSESDEFYDGGRDTASVSNTKNETFNISAALAHRWSERQSVALSINYTDYNNLDAENGDYQMYGIAGQFSNQWTERTNLIFSTAISIDDPVEGSKSTSYSLMGGFGSTINSKMNYQAMVGVMFYDYSGSGSQSDSSIAPNYSLTGTWKLSQRFALSAAMSTNYAPTDSAGDQGNSYNLNHNMSLALNFQPRSIKALSFRWDVGYRIEQTTYTNNQSDTERNYYNMRMSAYYGWNQYISLYTSVTYNYDTTDTTGDSRSSDEIRVDAGLQFKW